jgi:ferredoxin
VRIVIDKSRCTGHARCNWLAPDLIDLDDEGFAVPPGGPVPADRAKDAIEIRDNCPEGAIKLLDVEGEA